MEWFILIYVIGGFISYGLSTNLDKKIDPEDKKAISIVSFLGSWIAVILTIWGIFKSKE